MANNVNSNVNGLVDGVNNMQIDQEPMQIDNVYTGAFDEATYTASIRDQTGSTVAEIQVTSIYDQTDQNRVQALFEQYHVDFNQLQNITRATSYRPDIVPSRRSAGGGGP